MRKKFDLRLKELMWFLISKSDKFYEKIDGGFCSSCFLITQNSFKLFQVNKSKFGRFECSLELSKLVSLSVFLIKNPKTPRWAEI